MQLWRSLVAVCLIASHTWAADQPTAPPPTNLCANGVPGAPACIASPQARQDARKAFDHAMKLQKQNRLEDAFLEFEAAASLLPQDLQYATLRELTRQQLVSDHLQRGNAALAEGREIEALGEFRSALHFDPHNDFAQERLNDAIRRSESDARRGPRLIESSDEIRVTPKDVVQGFHYRGDSRGLLTQVANAYGITVTMDDSVVSRPVRFDVDDVGFYQAMQLAGVVTKTFWAPLQDKQIIIATDSAENRRLYDRMGLRTFYIPEAGTPQELQDIVNVLRTVFEMKFVSSNTQKGTITVRAPVNVLEPASRFMESLGSSHPEVMLDVHVFEISKTVVDNFGIHIPTQFRLFNIPIGALGLTLAGGQSIQDAINQLIASGGINQGNSSALAGLLGQLLGGNAASILSQPLATFGNGMTLFGVSLGTLSAQLSRNEGMLRSLQHVTVRAAQGKDANVNLGSRIPIVNASFAPIFNTSAISQAIGNGSYIPPIPSFSYEDIGLTLKVKPSVHGDSDVSMNIELKVRALTGASANGVPVIGNREYTGSINVKNDQAAVVAGQISNTEQRSLSGIPGISQFPTLSHVIGTNTREKDESEMLITITPHIISMPGGQSSEIWMTGVK
jgi:general secretion pathway protein D